MLKAIEVGKVHLLPGLFREREEVNRQYLLELQNQGLLQNFYLEAGIVMPGLGGTYLSVERAFSGTLDVRSSYAGCHRTGCGAEGEAGENRR